MPEAFDPYLKWLGIRSPERPPHHYALLGLTLFEDDTETIANAADRQMAHVRTFHTGRHSALSQQLLNELASARLCLLNRDKKRRYDVELGGQLQPQNPRSAATASASATAEWNEEPEDRGGSADEAFTDDASEFQEPVEGDAFRPTTSARVMVRRPRKKQSPLPVVLLLMFGVLVVLILLLVMLVERQPVQPVPARDAAKGAEAIPLPARKTQPR